VSKRIWPQDIVVATGGFNMEVSVQGGPGCGEPVKAPMTPGDLELVEIRVKEPVEPDSFFKNQEGRISV